MARLADKFAQQAKGLGSGTSGSLLGAQRPTLTELPLEQIIPDPAQPRRDLGDLTDLKASIAENGIVQPIIVSVAGYESYQIIAGERRFTAAKELGLATVPAIVRSVEEHQRLAVQIIENLHRKDLTPQEEAESYQRLMREFGLTQEELAKRVGKSQESVNETMRLMDLPERIWSELGATQGRVSKSVLLEIARRPTEEQEALWEQAKGGGLTVRKLREAKKPTPKNVSKNGAGFRYPIHLDGVIVTLAFEQPKPSQEDIVTALEEALISERARLG